MSIPAEIKKLFSAARLLGSGDDRVTLSENELFCLLTQCCNDLAIPAAISRLPPLSAPPPSPDYYCLPLSWFQTPQAEAPTASALLSSLAACATQEPDFGLYFSNLSTPTTLSAEKSALFSWSIATCASCINSANTARKPRFCAVSDTFCASSATPPKRGNLAISSCKAREGTSV